MLVYICSELIYGIRLPFKSWFRADLGLVLRRLFI